MSNSALAVPIANYDTSTSSDKSFCERILPVTVCVFFPPLCLAWFLILEYLYEPAERLCDSAAARQRPDPARAAAAVISVLHIFIPMVYLFKECSSARVIVL